MGAIFNKKLRTGLIGRFSSISTLKNAVKNWDKKRPIYWFHSASHGEFEQVKPVLKGLKEVDNELQLVVADNGKGYDLNEVNPLSFGNKLVSSLIQQLDGDMTVTNIDGTRIRMAFKSYKISRTNS